MRRALVTGASRGIGAAIHALFNDVGYTSFRFSRTGTFKADGAVKADRDRVKEYVGHCDILVNNLGGGGRYGTPDEVWEKNVMAMADFTQWALSGMLERGWGRVVTISSIHGREYGSRPSFMAAKAAQIAYMKGLSREQSYVRNGITFNTVCPGNVRVEGKPLVDESALPLGRMGTPGEIARVVAFLCEKESAYINGATLTIDGGESYAI